MKTEFKAIAMRCNQEQFESVKIVLSDYNFNTSTVPNEFKEHPYLLIKPNKGLSRCNESIDDAEYIDEFCVKTLFERLNIPTVISPDPTFIERYNITDKVKELLNECKKQGFTLGIDNGVIILKQI